MLISRLLTNIEVKRKLAINLKRFIFTTSNLNVKLNNRLLLASKPHDSDSVGKKNPYIDEDLIKKLVDEDPLVDKSELDKPQWERSTRNVLITFIMNFFLIKFKFILLNREFIMVLILMMQNQINFKCI